MKYIAFLCLFFLFLATNAVAEPSYWRVVGVAADDTLNVRAGPSASTADIGDIPPDAIGIEVDELDASGGWGRIVWEEGNGWLSMRFLEPDPQPQVSGTMLPVGLLCAGTEPFWSMHISAATATYSDLSGALAILTQEGARVAEGRMNFPVHIGYSGSGAAASALIAPDACQDGMSDRVYPWRIDLLLRAGANGRYLTGCCNLPLEAGTH